MSQYILVIIYSLISFNYKKGVLKFYKINIFLLDAESSSYDSTLLKYVIL